MNDKLKFKVDYLNGIIPITRVDSFFESLRNINEDFSLEHWVNSCYAVRGIRNYNTRFHYQGKNEFIVSWNAINEDEIFIAKSPEQSKFNPYIYITLSGNALNYFDVSSFDKFIKYLYRLGFKCTRLDVACDIFNRENVIVPYILQSFKFNSNMHKPENVPFVTSSMSLEPKVIKSTGRYKRPVQYTSVSDVDGNISENLTFGSHDTYLGMFRVYDKFLERGLDIKFSNSNDVLDDFHKRLLPERYWYRIEVEMHKQHAKNLFDVWVLKDLPIYDLFASALCSMFEIRISRSHGYRVNDCDISPVWQEFLNELSNNIHFV